MQHNVTRPFAKGGQPGFIARSAVRCGEPHQGPSGGVCHVAKGQCGMKLNKTCAGCSPPAGSCHGYSCPGWANSTECYHGVDDVEEGLQVRTRIISFAPFRSLPGQFTKTGSGQTNIGKTQNRDAFSYSRMMMTSAKVVAANAVGRLSLIRPPMRQMATTSPYIWRTICSLRMRRRKCELRASSATRPATSSTTTLYLSIR
eukprot:COSAG06_NODE_998_length_11146_cov_9.671495_7_plen_201_part_00